MGLIRARFQPHLGDLVATPRPVLGRERGAMDEPRTLAIDIGGTGIKAALLDQTGKMIGERQRVPTPPKPVAPEDLVRAIDQAVTPLGAFERVSVGFPGYVREGRV